MFHATFEVTNFTEQVLRSTIPVLVEFGAEWCPPCKMLAPTVHALATKYEGKLLVGLLDADEYPEIIQKYGVMGLPTLILFRDGKEAKRLIGYQPRERIEAQLLASLQPQNS